MKNFINISATRRNNLGLFLQLSVFALLVIMSSVSGQTAAQTPTPTPPPAQRTCTPGATIIEGDLLPGGIVSFNVFSGPGVVIVDHLDAGTGLQSLTIVGMPTNAVVNIPEFTAGTTDPVAVTFTTPNPGYRVDFTLRAASEFYAVFIRVRCAEICAPTVTTSEGDLFPSGFPFFDITSGPGTVTVDHIDAGSGLQSLTTFGVTTNAIVSIPPFMVGTFDPAVVIFRPIDPYRDSKFSLRAANLFHAVFIHVRCSPSLPAQLVDDDSK